MVKNKIPGENLPETVLRTFESGAPFQIYLTNEVGDDGEIRTYPLVQDVFGHAFVYRERHLDLETRKVYAYAVATMAGTDFEQLEEAAEYIFARPRLLNTETIRQAGLYYPTGRIGDVKFHSLRRHEPFVMSTTRNPEFKQYGDTPFAAFHLSEKNIAAAADLDTPVWVSMCIGNQDRLGRACYLPLSSSPQPLSVDLVAQLVVPVVVNATLDLTPSDDAYPAKLFVPTGATGFLEKDAWFHFSRGEVVDVSDVLRVLGAFN